MADGDDFDLKRKERPHMKKRVSGIISLVLALVLLVSLSACGNQNSGQTSGAETVSAETAALEETDAPETETVSNVPEDVSSAVQRGKSSSKKRLRT